MEWTREMRYRKLEDVQDNFLATLKTQVDSCPYRQTFHVQPPTGLLNDPNGLAYYNGEYHLFYQWYPLGPVHGVKYWYHTKSSDLVNWEEVGIGLSPDTKYDSHGAYSGSGFAHDGKLYLMYTGNHRTADWTRLPTQMMAIMDKDGVIEKLPEPVIGDVPAGYTDHFRDPKVWQDGDNFYAIIGAQRLDASGCVVIYQSKNLVDWEFKGELATHLPDFGYMWECPDYFELDGQGVLVYSPQGLDSAGDKYHNIYQAGYMIGKPMDMKNLSFDHGDFVELDRGFDFYAPQTMDLPDGRRILIGWMGLPEIAYPTDRNGWAHCMTLPRELQVVDGKLIQKPVKELEALRQPNSVSFSAEISENTNFGTGKQFELEAKFSNMTGTKVGINLRTGNGEKTVFYYDRVAKKIILDRTLSGESFGEDYGTVRKTDYDGDSLSLRIFVDTSSIEIFVNNGEHAFTSRIFPTNDENNIEFFVEGGSVDVRAEKWELRV